MLENEILQILGILLAKHMFAHGLWSVQAVAGYL